MARDAIPPTPATWVIGDVHGHAATLRRLLEAIRARDEDARFWFVGDLVNRGPDDVGVLREVLALGKRATVVLGNHELVLLACAAGATAPRDDDTIASVLAAADASALVEWIRHRPLLVRAGNDVLVHAGLHPTWTLSDAESIAARLHAALRAPEWADWLRTVWPFRGRQWPTTRGGPDRDGADLHALMSIRCVMPNGDLEGRYKGPPGEAPPPLCPWHAAPSPREQGIRVFTGHWAAQGLVTTPAFVALDTGCAWGGHLTAYRASDGALLQVSARDGAVRDHCSASISGVPFPSLP